MLMHKTSETIQLEKMDNTILIPMFALISVSVMNSAIQVQIVSWQIHGGCTWILRSATGAGS